MTRIVSYLCAECLSSVRLPLVAAVPKVPFLVAPFVFAAIGHSVGISKTGAKSLRPWYGTPGRGHDHTWQGGFSGTGYVGH